jgi:hypothetical protein
MILGSTRSPPSKTAQIRLIEKDNKQKNHNLLTGQIVIQEGKSVHGGTEGRQKRASEI